MDTTTRIAQVSIVTTPCLPLFERGPRAGGSSRGPRSIRAGDHRGLDSRSDKTNTSARSVVVSTHVPNCLPYPFLRRLRFLPRGLCPTWYLSHHGQRYPSKRRSEERRVGKECVSKCRSR